MSEPLPLGDGPTVRRTSSGGLAQIGVRALCRGAVRRQGVLEPGTEFPRIVVGHAGVTFGRERLSAYERVCEVRAHRVVPPAALELLFLPSMAELALHRAFPLSPWGLIHLRQQVRSHAAVGPEQALDLRTEVAAARRTARGVEVDLLTTATASGQRVWDGLTTLLSRNAATRPREDARAGDATVREGQDVPVPEDTGRAYAAVSGDYNPHHLWPWSARLLGYRAPIAHGMWTMGFLLGFVDPGHLDPPVRLDASFKRPLYLPGALRVVVEDDDDPYLVEGIDPRRGAPHVRLLVHRDLAWDPPGPP